MRLKLLKKPIKTAEKKNRNSIKAENTQIRGQRMNEERFKTALEANRKKMEESKLRA